MTPCPFYIRRYPIKVEDLFAPYIVSIFDIVSTGTSVQRYIFEAFIGRNKQVPNQPTASTQNPVPVISPFINRGSFILLFGISSLLLSFQVQNSVICYWRDYLRTKVIRDLNRGRSPTAGRFSWQFMGVLKKRKSGGGGDIFFSSAETSQLNNLLRGSAPGLVQKGEDVHGLNSQGANDVNGAQVKPRHNARIRNANILSDF